MKRILLVESDAALRAELRHALEGAGYAVDDTSTCTEASRRQRQCQADAMLIDLDDSAALDPLTRMLESRDTPPVLALVAPRSLALALALRRRGVRAVLRKPFDLRELETQLAAIASTRAGTNAHEFVTRDPATLRTLRLADATAGRNTTLLVEGESGTGKTLLSQRVHLSRAGRRAFRALDLAEPENTRAGLRGAEQAGTLLLPAIHQSHPESQAVLIDWLEQQNSGNRESAGPRIVSTTCRPLPDLVARGKLRPDLGHRLAVVALTIPPLRERLCDLPALIRHFASCTGSLSEDSIDCSPEALLRLAEHPFRGNVRELENRVHRLAALAPEAPIDARRLLEPDPLSVARQESTRRSLKELEREAIEASLARHGNNRTQASRELGISVRTLRNKLHRYGLA